MCKRIHSHPAMERKLGVPEDHVIIDRELYIELVKAACVEGFLQDLGTAHRKQEFQTQYLGELFEPSKPYAVIEGSEVKFRRELYSKGALDNVVRDIWANPSKYDPEVTSGTSGAYYNFLKFLWIMFSDGKSCQLAEYHYDLEESNG